MIEQVLKQIEITCSNREKVLCTNKVGSIVEVDIVDDIKIAKVILKTVRSRFSQSRSKIQSTQSRYRLIKFGDGKRKQVEELVR